jgi:flagellar basal-body rod protein FlgB
MSWLTDPTQKVLSGALTGLSTRQALIAGNIANIDTPGFHPQSIDFEATLQAAIADGSSPSRASTGATVRPPTAGMSAAAGMQRTDARHFAGLAPSGQPGSFEASTFDGSIRNDTNTVDLESEMTALAESQLKFSAVANLLSGRLGMLRDVVRKG